MCVPNLSLTSLSCLNPVVQSIVTLTSLLDLKMYIVLVSTVSNSQVFLQEKYEHLLQMQKLLTFFPQKYYYLMIKVLNKILTNNIISFEQMGPDVETQDPLLLTGCNG